MDTDDYWFHVRPSNTEAVLRVIAEGKKGHIEEVLNQLIKQIEAMIEEY